MKRFLVILTVLLFIFCGFIIYDTYSLKTPILEIEDDFINIDKLYIYGTHLNIEGDFPLNILDDDVDFVLYNGEFISYKINVSESKFNFSNYINDGIYLDDIPKGDYYLFLRKKFLDGEEVKYKYYALNNSSGYDDTTYYTMSNYNKKIIIKNEDSYPTMMMSVSNNDDDNIYDIVIDPGHGGRDGGANKNGYKETDFTLELATKIKNKLEKNGFKVKLTHEVGHLSSDEKLEEYGVHGRAVIPREVNAKYIFSFHLNSSNSSSVSGLEVYTAKNINYDFAKLLVNNIVNYSGIGYSSNRINKIYDGIYSRNFTIQEINSSIKDYTDNNLQPYDISTNSNYYYIVRETGGIVTGAYVDDRNDEILGNPYVYSNVGTEAYLLELGYLSNKNDLNNMINNMDKYVEGISNSIMTLYMDNN